VVSTWPHDLQGKYAVNDNNDNNDNSHKRNKKKKEKKKKKLQLNVGSCSQADCL